MKTKVSLNLRINTILKWSGFVIGLFETKATIVYDLLFRKPISIVYLTIIRRRRGDYRGEYSPRRSRGEYSPKITEPEANNCVSIFTHSSEYEK